MSEPVLAGFAHGTSSPLGQRLVAALMDAVAASASNPVALGYVDVQHPDIAETFAAIDAASPVVVVPLLLSAGYHVHVDLSRAVKAQEERSTALSGALGPDARLVTLLIRRLNEAGVKPDDAVVLCVAGSSDKRAVADCEKVAAHLSSAMGRPVTIGYLSAAQPRLDEAVRSARSAGQRVIVSTYLLAPGFFHDLAVAGGGDVTTAPLLATHDKAPNEVVEVILDRYAEGVARL